MKKIITTLSLLIICLALYSQKNPFEQSIVDEGMKLYRLELASWYGTDIFYEKFPKEKDNIGGYFSYVKDNKTVCVFYDRNKNPQLLARISFDKDFNVKKAKIDKSKGKLTEYENEFYILRKNAISEMLSDTMFKFYENSRPNLIPFVEGNIRKVFVLTGSLESEIVIFGNDYLLTFDSMNNVISKEKIHDNIMFSRYSSTKNKESKELFSGPNHYHTKGGSDFITSTDICTIMLYFKQANWKTYTVTTEKNICIWFCDAKSLAVTPRTDIENFLKNGE